MTKNILQKDKLNIMALVIIALIFFVAIFFIFINSKDRPTDINDKKDNTEKVQENKQETPTSNSSKPENSENIEKPDTTDISNTPEPKAPDLPVVETLPIQ